ncbi:MAG: OFA family MFS transporter [Nitrospirae bacterium]|nr:OFA family MFS transporter [Nitrospirota bacterium]
MITGKDTVQNKGWTVTLAGIGINLALGVLYAWSVIKKAIPSEWGWSDADKALPYSIACIVFALVMVPAGRLQDRVGPRWVATAGGLLTGIGCIIASYAVTVLWFVIGFGIFAGAGIGLGYASATPPAVKWFSARKTGLIAGLVVAGFGLASVYISPVANYLTGFSLTGQPLPEVVELARAKDLADREYEKARTELATTQAEFGGLDIAHVVSDLTDKDIARKDAAAQLLALKERNIHRTLLFFGVGFLIVVTLLAQFLIAPPAGYQPPDAGPGAAKAAAAAAINLGPGEILRTPLFYLLWTMYAFAAGAGLMIIGNITTIAKLGKIEAGFILVALLAIGNAAGRIIAGMLSDRIGRLWTMCIIFLFQAGLMMVLRTGLGNMTAFVVVSMLLGFNYGACLSVFPSAVKDNFGLRNFGINYGLVFTAWGVGGFIFPLVAGRLFETAKKSTGTGSYNEAYLIAAVVLVLAAVLTFAARTIEKRHKDRFAR